MKNLAILIFYSISVSQTNAQTSASLMKEGDSLYKVKDYTNAAIAYSNAIRLDGSNARVSMYWSASCTWSLAKNADSAFYYLGLIEKSNKANVADASEIENDSDFNFIKTDKRWQPAISGILKNAVSRRKKFTDDVRSGKRINPSRDKYQLAVAWAGDRNADSTFYYLNDIINTSNNKYVFYKELTEEKKFSFLHSDPRWVALKNEVQKNSPPFTCEHTPRYGRVPMRVTIDPSSEFLKSDGKGSYDNGKDKVVSYILTAYNLLLSGVPLLEESGDFRNKSSRYFTINLNKPVKKTGAVKHGVIKDHFGSFHTFYRIDTALKLDLICHLNFKLKLKQTHINRVCPVTNIP